MGDYLSTITTTLGPRKTGMLGMSLKDPISQIGSVLPKLPDISNYPRVLPKETMDKVNEHLNSSNNIKNGITAMGARLGTDYLSN